MPTDWTDISDSDATWTLNHQGPEFGVQYNSVLLYNGSHTYNEASTPYVHTWTDGAGNTTTWT